MGLDTMQQTKWRLEQNGYGTDLHLGCQVEDFLV
jgi:hypothetical protein